MQDKKVIVVGGILYGWMRSIKMSSHYVSTLLVIILVSLIAGIFKFPLTSIIRDAEATVDTIMAIIWSVPLLAIFAWQYAVWYYTLEQVSNRTKTEVLAVLFTLAVIPAVVGTVLSKLGSPVGGF